MRKLILLAVTCASLSLPLCTLFAVRATASVRSIYDVQLGMDMLDVLAGLQGKYAIDNFDVVPAISKKPACSFESRAQ
jgi:hypothetical protein